MVYAASRKKTLSKKDKKAFSISIIAIIIAVIVLIFYLYFGAKIPGIMKEANAREACRNSVILYMHAKNLPGASAEQLECHTQFVDVRKEGIKKNGNLIESEVSAFSVQRAIANEMYDCWYQFAQGNQEIFGRSWQVDIQSFNSQCVICSEISINPNNEPEVTEKIGSITNFFQFLKDTRIQQASTEGGGSTQTYYDYLGRTSPSFLDYTGLLNQMGSEECSSDLYERAECVVNPAIRTVGQKLMNGEITVPGEYAVVFKSMTPLRVNFPKFEYLAAIYLVDKTGGDLRDMKCEQLY